MSDSSDKAYNQGQSSSHNPSDAPLPRSKREGMTTNDVRGAAEEALEMARRLNEKPATKPLQTMFTPLHGLALSPPEDAPLLIVPDFEHERQVGRSDDVVNYKPDIDLTAYGAYRLGISRQHAKFFVDGQVLKLIDLGSRNGTQVNGRELRPHEACVVADGDEIHFANMKVIVHFRPPASS